MTPGATKISELDPHPVCCPHCGVQIRAVAIKNVRLACPKCGERYGMKRLGTGQWQIFAIKQSISGLKRTA